MSGNIQLGNIQRQIPQQLKVDMPGASGTLPIPAGVFRGDQLAANSNTSDIPAHIMAETADTNTTEAIPAKPRIALKRPPMVDMASLPAAKQAELLKSIETASTQKISAKPPTKTLNTPERTNPTVAASATQEPASAQPVLYPTAPADEVRAPEAPKVCSHCHWPVDRCSMTDPTSNDKQNWVVAKLAQGRFYKEYNLYGGKMKVIFRSLSVKEVDLIGEQIMVDWKNSKLPGFDASVHQIARYQLALSLHALQTQVGLRNLPVLEEYDITLPKGDNNTILKEFTDMVHTTIIIDESLRRVLAKAYNHFLDTQSKLEALAEDPDFSVATEN